MQTNEQKLKMADELIKAVEEFKLSHNNLHRKTHLMPFTQYHELLFEQYEMLKSHLCNIVIANTSVLDS